MLFSEFQEGTGCKDNEYNYKVYKDLEVMYMNSNMSKAEIYEYGKKLVDNSKSEQELALEKQIQTEIAGYKMQIEQLKGYLKDYEACVTQETNVENKKYWRMYVKQYKKEIAECRAQIRALKWVLA